MAYRPLGSSVHGILQARILDWVAIPFSGDLPDLEIEPGSPAVQADSLPSDPLRQHIKKHHFSDKGPDSESYGFSSRHESWTINKAEC